MTVKFSIVPKKDPRNLGAPPKYYPTVTSTGRLDLRTTAKRIAEMSTVSRVDTIAVLEAFLTVVPQELANGNIVELGEFGAFRLTALASGEDRPEKVGARNIKEVKVRLCPTFRSGPAGGAGPNFHLVNISGLLGQFASGAAVENRNITI